MEMNEIGAYHLNTEAEFQDLNELTAKFVISEYKKLGRYHKYYDNPLASLLRNYFDLKKKGKHQVLEEIPELDPNDDKLQVLALYYGKKKGIK